MVRMVMTDAIPIITPRRVRADRILLVRRFDSARVRDSKMLT